MHNEIGWQPLRQRREVHKICKMYDIVNGHTPPYLKNLLPRNLNASRRLTRGSAMGNFAIFRCKTETFRKSFFPSGILSFNNQSAEDKALTRHAFKNKLRKTLKSSVPPHFYAGKRKYNIVLSQMRLRFCNLNFYLQQKGCIDSGICQCGHDLETLDHYFFTCALFAEQREELLLQIRNINENMTVDINLLLFGLPNDSPTNSSLLEYVLSYIENTNRF